MEDIDKYSSVYREFLTNLYDSLRFASWFLLGGFSKIYLVDLSITTVGRYIFFSTFLILLLYLFSWATSSNA